MTFIRANTFSLRIAASLFAGHCAISAAQPPETAPYGEPVISETAKQAIRAQWQASDADVATRMREQVAAAKLSPALMTATTNLKDCLTAALANTKAASVDTDQILGQCEAQQAQLKTQVPEPIYDAAISQLRQTIAKGSSSKSEVMQAR